MNNSVENAKTMGFGLTKIESSILQENGIEISSNDRRSRYETENLINTVHASIDTLDDSR